MQIRNLIWLIVLALLWGPAFLFTKVVVEEIPPFTLVAVRVSLAAVILYLILKAQGLNLPKSRAIWKHSAVMGLLYNAVPYVLLSWGEQYIDSALAAILIGTIPIFTVLLSHFFIGNDQLTPAKIGGVLIGFSGVIFLVLPALLSGVQATLWGLLAALVAASSYAGAVVYGKQYLRGLPPLVGPTTQLLLASVFLIPVSLIVEQPYTLSLPSWPVLGSLLLLSVVSTVLAFIVYYRAMEIMSALNLSMTSYLIPVVATVLGVVILAERLGWHVYLGCLLIILSMMMVNGLLQSLGRRRVAGTAAQPGK